jgi:hypothetical protein
VRLGAAAFARLKCALWQSNPPLLLRSATSRYYAGRVAQAAFAAESNYQVYWCLAGGVKEGAEEV